MDYEFVLVLLKYNVINFNLCWILIQNHFYGIINLQTNQTKEVNFIWTKHGNNKYKLSKIYRTKKTVQDHVQKGCFERSNLNF